MVSSRYSGFNGVSERLKVKGSLRGSHDSLIKVFKVFRDVLVEFGMFQELS